MSLFGKIAKTAIGAGIGYATGGVAGAALGGLSSSGVLGGLLGGKKPPGAPNYTNLANQQFALNQESNRNTTQANRINQSNPYGSLSYTQDPNDPDKWSSSYNLDPTQQGFLNQSNQLTGNLLGQANGLFSQGFDRSSLPSAPINAGTTGMDAILKRLEPTLNRQRTSLDSQLINRGLAPGSEAYHNAMTDQGQRENDLYSQAALQGIGLDNDARANAIQEQSFFRREPLDLIAGLRNSGAVVNPQFTNYTPQAGVGAPDILGAADSQYAARLGNSNARQASRSNTLNGLFGLGSAAISAYGGK